MMVLMELARDMFERFGYEVVVTTDSSNALKIFREQHDRFDLIITDMTVVSIVLCKILPSQFLQ